MPPRGGALAGTVEHLGEGAMVGAAPILAEFGLRREPLLDPANPLALGLELGDAVGRPGSVLGGDAAGTEAVAA